MAVGFNGGFPRWLGDLLPYQPLFKKAPNVGIAERFTLAALAAAAGSSPTLTIATDLPYSARATTKLIAGLLPNVNFLALLLKR